MEDLILQFFPCIDFYRCKHPLLVEVIPILFRVLQKIFYVMIYNGSSETYILNPLGKHIMRCNKRKSKGNCEYCVLTKCQFRI